MDGPSPAFPATGSPPPSKPHLSDLDQVATRIAYRALAEADPDWSTVAERRVDAVWLLRFGSDRDVDVGAVDLGDGEALWDHSAMNRTETVAVGDVSLFVRRLGVGRGHHPLVVLHGGPSWDHSYLLPGLEPLATKREVLAFDQRGCGRSSRDLPITSYQPEHIVADTARLLAALGFDRVDLLGFSTGGQVAQLFVQAHPDKVRRLVLASTTAYRDFGQHLQSWPEYQQRVTTIPPTPSGLDDLEWTEHDAAASAVTAIWDLAKLPRYRHLLDQIRFSGDWLAPWQQGLLHPWRPEDPEQVLRDWGRPVLILHGEHDMGFPIQVAHRLHHAVPNSELAVLQAGHMAHFELPDAWSRQVAAFLDAVD